MVYLSGSKSARNQASIVNRTNTCGGSAKKSGLAPRVGWFMQSNPSLVGAPQKLPLKCVPQHNRPNPKNRIPCYNWWKHGLRILYSYLHSYLNIYYLGKMI